MRAPALAAAVPSSSATLAGPAIAIPVQEASTAPVQNAHQVTACHADPSSPTLR
jgi:hypothetical protein